jgi:collagenase-like PrtC family protease
MAGLEFSAPYNNDPETLEELFKLKSFGENRIREIYLSGPQEYSGSGRITKELNLGQFIGIVDKIHEQGIRVNLVFNTTCEGTEWYSPEVVSTKMEFLKRVHEDHGVEAVTIANPLFIREVRRWFPNLEICASVLGDIDCVQRAVIYANAGANVITPDVNVNRDLALLKEIKKATNAELKVMVNEGCLYKCPFRKFHFNYMSHKSKELGKIEGDAFFANCLEVSRGDPAQVLKSGWIRPEDTRKYSEVATFFKIVGRARPMSMVLRTSKAYLEENWDGDLLDIVSSSLNRFGLEYGANLDNKSLDKCDFFETMTSCGYDCKHCRYCNDLAERLIRFRVLTRGKLEDLGLKDEADELERTGRLGQSTKLETL